MTNLGLIGAGKAEMYAAVAVAVATIALSLIDNFVFKPNNAFIPKEVYILIIYKINYIPRFIWLCNGCTRSVTNLSFSIC